MVVAGFAELSSRLEALGAEADLVSFDIFDTLLERHVDPPDAVKAVAARRAEELFAAAEGGSHPKRSSEASAWCASERTLPSVFN